MIIIIVSLLLAQCVHAACLPYHQPWWHDLQQPQQTIIEQHQLLTNLHLPRLTCCAATIRPPCYPANLKRFKSSPVLAFLWCSLENNNASNPAPCMHYHIELTVLLTPRHSTHAVFSWWQVKTRASGQPFIITRENVLLKKECFQVQWYSRKILLYL